VFAVIILSILILLIGVILLTVVVDIPMLTFSASFLNTCKTNCSPLALLFSPLWCWTAVD